jgi:hypothetical protein
MYGKIVLLTLDQLSLIEVGLSFIESHGDAQYKKRVKELKHLFNKTLFQNLEESHVKTN